MNVTDQAILAGFSHDLKNLLLVISINKELLKLAPPDQHSHCAKRIEVATEYVHRLIDKSFVHQVKPTELEGTSLIPIIHDVVAILETTFPLVHFETEKANDFKLQVDSCELFRCIMNLTLNAASAASSNSGEAALVEFKTTDSSSGFSLSVIDNGGGFAFSEPEKPFTPYVTTKKGSGHGLGLFVVKTFTDQSRATINILRQYQKTVVKICFPTGYHGNSGNLAKGERNNTPDINLVPA